MISQLLNDHKINEVEIYDLLSSLFGTGSDYSDLYFQHSVAESWVLDEGIVKDGSYNISHGVGARCVSGDKTGFSYSDDLNLKAIQGAVDFARGISSSKPQSSPKIFKSTNYSSKYAAFSPLDSLTSEQKVDLLRQINTMARKEPKVSQVSASLSGAYTEVLIASSDGVYEIDCRPMV
jgi:TldD protein